MVCTLSVVSVKKQMEVSAELIPESKVAVCVTPVVATEGTSHPSKGPVPQGRAGVFNGGT